MKGIGEQLAKKLYRLNIDTIEDLEIPQTQSLLAPTKTVEETPPEPSLLGKM